MAVKSGALNLANTQQMFSGFSNDQLAPLIYCMAADMNRLWADYGNLHQELGLRRFKEAEIMKMVADKDMVVSQLVQQQQKFLAENKLLSEEIVRLTYILEKYSSRSAQQ